MKKPSELKIGERMIDHMPDGELKEWSSHICMKKLCDRNHFCPFDADHPGKCTSIIHGVMCK